MRRKTLLRQIQAQRLREKAGYDRSVKVAFFNSALGQGPEDAVVVPPWGA